MATGETRVSVSPRAENRPGVPAIRKWTAREIRALRDAARMSRCDFAVRLGISDRIVVKWEAGDVKNLRPDSQAALDAFLRDAAEDVRARFAATLGDASPKSPNHVLRDIRERERRETRAQFAEAMTRIAGELGEEVYPDEKYVERLESGAITWPRPPIRNVLVKLCGRPMGDLGFIAPALSWRDSADSVDDPGRTRHHLVNVPLRNAILASGLEVTQFARRVGVDPKTVERWIAQGRVPYARHRWKACQILRCDESELWPDPNSGGRENAAEADGEVCAAPAISPSAEPGMSAERHSSASEEARDLWETGYDSDEELMRRRAFLVNVAALAGLGAADTPAAVEAIRQELNISLVEERAGTHADEWQEIVLDYGESYPTAAPAELIRTLMVDMLGMQAALRRHDGATQHHDLLRVAALLSAFTAQTVANMGQPLEARRWWRTAKNAADRSGDPYSALWVRGREITRAMESRPVPVILRLIDDAEGITAMAPPEATLELVAAKAQTLALAGRERAATETLIQLRRQFSQSPTGYSGSMLSWGQERLHNTESFAYSRLGILPNAESATIDGLALYAANSPTSVRHPAQLQLNLAFALVRSGDVSGGLKHARDVIGGLPEAHRRTRIDDGRKLLSVVPLPEQRRADVQEYREWVNSLPESAKE